MRRYYVYDFRRNSEAEEFWCESDELAVEEFAVWFNMVVSSWETRTLGRYFLFRDEVDAHGEWVPPSSFLGVDEDVRLNRHWFFMRNPPHCEAAERALVAEFDRLDKVDADRLIERGNARSMYLNGQLR